MLSHLRFHRRGPSNPSSPIPENSPWDSAALQPAQLVPEDGVPTPEIRLRSDASIPFAHTHGQPPLQSSQPTSPLSQQQQQQPLQRTQPPVLPPIARISSAESDLSIDLVNSDPKQHEEFKQELKPLPRSPYNEDTGFIGGLALQNYRREQEALKPVSSERNTINASDSVSFGTHSSVANFSNRPPPPTRHAKAASSFISPSSLQNATTTSKRSTSAKMAPEPQVSQNQAMAVDAPRGKKSLPFLKNPMSTLLLRRKTSQNVPDLTLPLRGHDEEPSYDPRIRGTRVHDFSAPRPRKVVTINESTNLGAEKSRPDTISPTMEYNSPTEAPPVPPKDDSSQSARSSSTYSRTLSVDTASLQKSQGSRNSLPSAGSRIGQNSQRRKSSIPPSLMSLSRNVSEASARDVLSSLPRHMKSTSSRFSFDMIGAAKQEKLLEERHRQRQQDRKADETHDQRDSRFDDFDEDAFDYDAMDYDDGLEERIPGVNADYEEEEFYGADDPDNDQENFSGFVFQRSNPISELTSPRSAGVLPTPRDESGNVIGYAMTEEEDLSDIPQPLNIPANDRSEAPTTQPSEGDTPTGLGIQGLGAVNEMPRRMSFEQQRQEDTTRKPLSKDDELYFNDGLIHDFDGEGDGSAFDESIFDLDDTDQYGRPIPGLFANALSQRQAGQEAKKRESDMTSRLSAQSELSQSTAHTSLSADLQHKPMGLDVNEERIPRIEERQSSISDLPAAEQDQIAAYQAALAAAAHQAAASGKFRRNSSPPPTATLTITSPTTSGSSQCHPDDVDDYEYDNELSSGLDDYELDDDDIIAEANASALANDSDGWYGQEFGFYSAPTPLHVHHGPSILSEKNIYHYSHGGYFGPSGVDRSTSGRIVSREPNLTPITERSEYSNRNSIMSLGVPQSANPNGPLQSPGLAQLAMMADDDNMSLSALLRLRSKAWGGSQASLVSSRDGSPSDRNGATSPWGHDPLGIGPSHGRKNSAFSIFSQDSTGAGSGSGSPTLTMSMPGIPNHAIPPLSVPSIPNPTSAASPVSAPVFSPLQTSSVCPPVFEDEETSPLDERKPRAGSASTSASGTTQRPFSENMSPTVGMPSQKRPGMGHRHRGSADSISYTKEEDSGETRWIMERRRTSESGEIEVLGRQVVDRGRI
ncbi:uncharacterized protein GGS22DRAFT_164611 [Annulohypoxylon maeteangense]|uniref:uncharacterized protein n=1 Tax=Annulohypoxylon maeteangense TaxID=1927788 RepID=UPI00200782E2|nr:uncharacterized protein GGS22DRAFT_164611 [Annulohypoxylon maeteangense]KAI0884905.1 hypothetical protein GGS22DRAFT_164611 [Annulohypoxylon maeteangense]